MREKNDQATRKKHYTYQSWSPNELVLHDRLISHECDLNNLALLEILLDNIFILMASLYVLHTGKSKQIVDQWKKRRRKGSWNLLDQSSIFKINFHKKLYFSFSLSIIVLYLMFT